VVESVRASAAFCVESAYAGRGGFTILPGARLEEAVGEEWVVVGFPSDAELIQAGSIAGLLAYHHRPSHETRYAHCLVAGPEAEITLASPHRLLDLPAPGKPADRRAYARERRAAWRRFWFTELEEGVRAASAAWKDDLWYSLLALLWTGAPEGDRRRPRPARVSAP